MSYHDQSRRQCNFLAVGATRFTARKAAMKERTAMNHRLRGHVIMVSSSMRFGTRRKTSFHVLAAADVEGEDGERDDDERTTNGSVCAVTP